MQLNVNKLFYTKQEVEYFGYVINRQGISSQQKKIKVIINK